MITPPDAVPAPAAPVTVGGHSRRVAYLKLMLPALALSIVTLVLAWPQLAPEEKRFRLTAARISAEDAETLRMRAAHYYGTDDQGQPYVVTAKEAIQVNARSNNIDMVDPKADLTAKSGAWMALTGDSGTYHQDKRTLDLVGDVSLFHDNGTEFHTTRAAVDFTNSSASGDDPVDGQGPSGLVNGEGFRLYDRGARIVFTGKARVVLYRDPGTRP